MSVPYLGHGPVKVDDEIRLQNGEHISTRKTDHMLSEVSYTDYHHYPLIDSIQSTVTNPHNLVEGVAKDGWIRGGLPSREVVQEK